jgi:hypothetical protein
MANNDRTSGGDQRNDPPAQGGDKRNDAPNTGGRIDRNSGGQNQGGKGGNKK